MRDPGAKKKEWLQFRLQASNGFVGLPNRLVDSKPFAALTTGASVRVLVWFWQAAEYSKGKKRKQGAEPVIGRIDKIRNNGELSFTYQEAGWRGMNARRFSRALKDLFRLGFIDIARHGRGVRGQYSKYRISERWKMYGTPEWQEIPFPENFREGFRSDTYRKRSKKIADENIRYSTDENVRYEVGKQPHNGRKRPLKVADSSNSQRTKSSVSIDLAMPTGSKKEVRKKVRTSDSRSKKIAIASKTKIRPAAIPTWPDQGKVLDLCSKLTRDVINRFGGNGDHSHPEVEKARDLADSINRATGSEVTH